MSNDFNLSEQDQDANEKVFDFTEIAEKDDNEHGLKFEVDPPAAQETSERAIDELRNSYKKSGVIAIRPYLNGKPNMGLEKWGMVLFPGTSQIVEMTCITFRGKTRYINGLDEFAPTVAAITNKEEKNARIKEIRTVIAQLELEKNFNSIDIEDRDFWNKVSMFRPDNKDVWGKMGRILDNRVLILDPAKNINDLLTIIAIENGGYPDIAKSLEDAKVSRRPVKWYLDKQSETVGTRTTYNKLKNKAGGILDKMSDENLRKLFYLAKVLEVNTYLYNYGTLPQQIYDVMDDYINGKGSESRVNKSASKFIEMSEISGGKLKIQALIKDAIFYKYIIMKSDQMLYEADTQILLGRNVSEVFEHLTNPLNDDVLQRMLQLVENKHWKN